MTQIFIPFIHERICFSDGGPLCVLEGGLFPGRVGDVDGWEVALEALVPALGLSPQGTCRPAREKLALWRSGKSMPIARRTPA